MNSNFYSQGHSEQVAVAVKGLPKFPRRISFSWNCHSPGAVGDALAPLVANKFENFLGNWCRDCSHEFARRSMADSDE